MTENPTRMRRLLDTVGRVGNGVPHPVAILVILTGLVVVPPVFLSLVAASVS